MSRTRRAVLWLVVAPLAACATAPRPNLATLRLACNVPDATLWIDDGLAGRVAGWAAGGALSAGFHRIEVRHPAYFTFYAELNPRAGEAVVLRAELRKTLD